MTHSDQSKSPVAGDDEAISSAVQQLLADREETVVDLAHFTRISPASIYRKLNGQAGWKAADVGAVARHFGVLPNDLFLGAAGPTKRGSARVGGGADHTRVNQEVTRRFLPATVIERTVRDLVGADLAA